MKDIVFGGGRNAGKVAAENVISIAVYRLGRADPKVGELRTKSWQCLIPPAGDRDALWTKRCADYWHTQERLYGLKMSDFGMIYDTLDGLGVVTTFSTVLGIRPGRRVRDYTPGWLIDEKQKHG